nr:MAG TPA: Protein of unknown function (DUF3139) [Caudoviricetes sp.]DAF27274.1 MAG TPA: hypothetical protein [Caudoviricetes sp.]DAG60706.1 MAG TPA: Protein of unknown function (DUF3139) [Bacteriophage sp.]DAP98580.1 MAG TPA: Protein of unknown function (DUF3139) [Caudoviricetes sp.]
MKKAFWVIIAIIIGLLTVYVSYGLEIQGL